MVEVTSEMVARAIAVAQAEGALPYGPARVRDFTDAEVRAGMLRDADRESDAANADYMRRVLTAALDGPA